MPIHRVQAGEYLSRIAARYGVLADDIWQHDGNADLRESRGDHDVLKPGEVVFVPPTDGLAVKPSRVTRFVARPRRIRIVVLMQDDHEDGIADRAYRAIPDVGDELSGHTDGDGRIELEVPMRCSQIRIGLEGERLVHVVRVGHLDPHRESTGAQHRLSNLGILRDPVHRFRDGDAGIGDERRASMEEATIVGIAAFQEAASLSITGECDDETADGLRAEHGS